MVVSARVVKRPGLIITPLEVNRIYHASPYYHIHSLIHSFMLDSGRIVHQMV